jgi:hypothetical protein
MTTVDNFLVTIIEKHYEYVRSLIPKKDFDILTSLAIAITGSLFITENQAKLLIKILQGNQKKLAKLSDDIEQALTSPTWSKPFRHIEQVKKLYLDSNLYEDESTLIVEFTFSGKFRQSLRLASKRIDGFSELAAGKKYAATYNEKNIVVLVELLRPLGFEIEEEIKNHYDTIKSWAEPEVRKQFLITNMTNQNFQNHITADLGIDTSIDQTIINDRSVRYQYFTENPKFSGDNLTENLANRLSPKQWIDPKTRTLSEVISSIIELKRLPMLVVFEHWDDEKTFKNLEKFSEILEEFNLDTNVGIYFRLDNTEYGKKFNRLIAEKKYNNKLDHETKIAAVQGGKLPKFFLKTEWKPMTVLGLSTKMGLRHGKTSVYSNCCDLIIEYTDFAPLLEMRKFV